MQFLVYVSGTDGISRHLIPGVTPGTPDDLRRIAAERAGVPEGDVSRVQIIADDVIVGDLFQVCWSCDWSGRQGECLHPKHIPDDLLCPDCGNLTFSVRGYESHPITP